MPASTHAIAVAVPSSTSAERPDETPADLPSDRARFTDALGRETALVERRSGSGRATASKRSANDADPKPAHGATRAKNAKREEPVDRGGPAAIELLLLAVDRPSSAPVDLEASAHRELGVDALLDEESPALKSVDLPRELAAVAKNDRLAPLVNEATILDSAARPERAASDADIATLLEASKRRSEPVQRISEPLPTTSSNEALTAMPNAASTSAREVAAPASARIDPAPTLDASIPSVVTLAELPRALQTEVDGFLRVRGRGVRWDAEIRLDPPDLGALHVRLELRGHELHGVVHVENRQLEPSLERMFHDLEENLRRQGGEASFEFARGTPKEEGRAWGASSPEFAFATPVDAATASGGARPAGDRLVDLFA